MKLTCCKGLSARVRGMKPLSCSYKMIEYTGNDNTGMTSSSYSKFGEKKLGGMVLLWSI